LKSSELRITSTGSEAAARRERQGGSDTPVARGHRERRPPAKAVPTHADELGRHGRCHILSGATAQNGVDHELDVLRAQLNELAEQLDRVRQRAAELHLHDHLDHVGHRIARMIDRRHDVPVAGQVRAQKRALASVPAKAVRKRDQWVGAGPRRRIAHRVLGHRLEAGQQVVGVPRGVSHVLARMCFGGRVPHLDGQRPLPRTVRGVHRAHPDR
jgi:hypothetical protein